MKILLALCLVVAAVSAEAPLSRNDPEYLRYINSLPVLYRTEIRDESNQFSASYGTQDGTEVEQRGVLKPTPDGSDYVLVYLGKYKFYVDGVPYTTNYVADENGFRAVGDHLPVAPPPVAPPPVAPSV